MKTKHLAVVDYNHESENDFAYIETALYDMDDQIRLYINQEILSARDLSNIIQHVFNWQDEGYNNLDVIYIQVDIEHYDDIESYMDEVFNEMNKYKN